jgi:succinate dehydrogenase / fumarate reductase cytochrome b subunit
MGFLATYLSSSIGKKQLMAVTGLAWCGFVLTHMLGNLLTLVGPDAYNMYGHKIVTNPFIYIAEAGLVFTLLLHIVFAIWTQWENRTARPVAYAVSPKGKGGVSPASKTLALSGLLILVFLVLHIITFKFGAYYTYRHSSGEEIRDLYRLMGETFVFPAWTLWYLLCLFVLFLHLSHALASSLRTLGLAVAEKKLLCLSRGFALLVAVGFAVNPIYFYFIKGRI